MENLTTKTHKLIGQKKNNNKNQSNNSRQTNTQKTKDQATRPLLETG
jgi:hypothetical protein